MNFDDIQTSIKSKLDDETISKISDDLANLITLNSSNNSTIDNLNKEIKKLKSDKETLISANGNLLQKVSAENESILNPKEDDKEEYKVFDFRSVYDEKGNFKRKL